MGKSGYSIIELVGALSLAAITLAIAGPTVSSSFHRTATRLAADEFVTTHRLARSMAARNGRIAELHILSSSARIWVEVDTSGGAGIKDTVGVVKNFADEAITVTSDRTILCFDSRGLPSTRGSCEQPDATVVFSAGGRADTVKITALGEVLR